MNTDYLYSDTDWLIYADYLEEQGLTNFVREDVLNTENTPWTYEWRISGVGVGGGCVGAGSGSGVGVSGFNGGGVGSGGGGIVSSIGSFGSNIVGVGGNGGSGLES